MTCEQAKEKLVDWLANQTEPLEAEALAKHCQQCPECAEELQSLRHVWQTMGYLPVPAPSEQLPVRFYAMLEEYKASTTPAPQSMPSLTAWLRRLWTPNALSRLAYSLVLLLVGAAAGYWLSTRQAAQSTPTPQIQALTAEVREMREMMLLSMIENPSATERLRAVSLTKAIPRVDARVVNALLRTLDNDPNVNVRLVTLEALYALADDPRVREGLVQAITRQESPLVQSALVDVMVGLQEKRSVKPLRELLKGKELNQSIKGKIEKGIQVLI